MNNIITIPHTENIKFFYGNFWYKWDRLLNILWAFIPIAIVGYFFVKNSLFAPKQSISTAIYLQAFLIVCITTIAIGIPAFILDFHLNPEFGVSSQELWYRFSKEWHTIPWANIKQIKPVTPLFVNKPIGFLIYSNQLPRRFALHSFMYGRTQEPALFVSNLLPGISDLKIEIETHLREAKLQTSASQKS